MARKISRRRLVAGLGAAAGGLAGSASGTHASPAASRLSLTGQVAWCNYQMGVMNFKPHRDDAGGCMVRLNVAVGERTLRWLLPPCSVITVNLAWRPDLDILAPWSPVEVITATGERVSATSRQGS